MDGTTPTKAGGVSSIRTPTKTGGMMSVGMRASAVLFITLLTLLSAAPALAADPVRRDGTAPEGSVEPTGVVTCDVRLSVVDGPLFDANFPVRVYEPFIIWGFGYPPDTDISIQIDDTNDVFHFSTMTDSAGEFADGLYVFDPGSEHSWLVGAGDTDPITCQDTIQMIVLPAHPFTDVAAFEREISWLHREGITGGCTYTRFCPSDPVTRGQMAAFLNRALNLPATGIDFFDDDDGTLFETNINRLAAAGITGGCAMRRYCPDATVSREQMASFLVRAFGLPLTSTDFFTDDDTSIHEGSINRLAASGITGGCAAGRYCPKSNVTREQMAAFLYRAYH